MFLTAEFYNLKKAQTNAQGTTSVNKTVTEIFSDVTEIVDKSEPKVVSIKAVLPTGTSYGSGAVYRVNESEVLVVTNAHVVAGANTLQVSFANGESVEATLVGSDEYTDLALLKMQVPFTVTAFNLGDSALSKKGEFVIAMGSPLGKNFEGSVSFGIISGKERVIPVDLNGDGADDWDMVVLQTDAALNNGNSGGPLINMAGELIGINARKISYSSSYTAVEGMGFAIPINEIIPIVTQLETTGKVTRPVIGITGNDISQLTDYQKNYLGIRLDSSGVLISKITPGGPAALAGILEGDIITAFDGQQVSSFKEFRKILYGKAIKDVVEIVVIRNEKEVSMNIILQ